MGAPEHAVDVLAKFGDVPTRAVGYRAGGALDALFNNGAPAGAGPKAAPSRMRCKHVARSRTFEGLPGDTRGRAGAWSVRAAIEDVPTAALRSIFESNFFGYHTLTRGDRADFRPVLWKRAERKGRRAGARPSP